MWWFGVAISGSSNDLSRMTDAREKGRIGIFGSALSYAGSYGRVTSESLGRDLNPLGRGDGGSYVAGGLNLGRIAPRLPKNAAASGTGNSVNNCGQGSPGPAADPMGGGGAGGPGQTPRGTDCECVSCCRGWAVSYSSQLQTGPAPCGKACDYCNAGAGGSCRDQECACRGCLWDYYNSIGEFQPSRYEVMCEDCCCDGCPCSSGSGGGGGAEGTGSGCPGCGRTGSWGPGDNGGGGGMPGFPPGWGIPGSGVTGPWRPLGYYEELPGDRPESPFDPPIPTYPQGFHSERYVEPGLYSLLNKLLECLEGIAGHHAECARNVLRTSSFRIKDSLRLDRKKRWRRWEGYTNPLTNTIYIDLSHWTQDSECDIMNTILHEVMHQCGVYGREMLLWPYYWGLIDYSWIYGYESGVSNNAAQREADELMKYCCCDHRSRYGVNWTSMYI